MVYAVQACTSVRLELLFQEEYRYVNKSLLSTQRNRCRKSWFFQDTFYHRSCFYGNNVVKVNTLKEAYNLAKNSPGTIVTDMPVYRGEEFGLDSDARVLLFNDGAITGRYATARRIAGEPGVDCDALDKVVMDAVYTARFKKLYHATVYAALTLNSW